MSFYVQITVLVDAKTQNEAQRRGDKIIDLIENEPYVLEANWWDVEQEDKGELE